METPNTPISKHNKPATACPRDARRRAGRPPKSVFLATALVIFFLSLSAADSVGFVPSYIDGTTESKVTLSNLPQLGGEAINATEGESARQVALPQRIVIPSISLDLPMQNLSTKNIEMLDEALKKGPVRYVDSAKLGEKGNMLVFAHSSHLPIVHNQMYRAFNRISELRKGDLITVSGDGKDYTYSVTNVRLTDASEEVIDLGKTQGTRLTLSTCDTFGKKSARWVVEAELVGAAS